MHNFEEIDENFGSGCLVTVTHVIILST